MRFRWVARGRAVRIVEGRDGLTAIELAHLFADVMARERIGQAELARRIGRAPCWVSNVLALRRLEPGVQDLVVEGRLGWAQARAICRLPAEQQTRLASRCVQFGLSAHAMEGAAARARMRMAT